MGKQPTHSDLMKEIVELKKKLEALEQSKNGNELEGFLEAVKKAMPKETIIPYPVPYYPHPYPNYPWYPYWTQTSGVDQQAYTVHYIS